MMIARPCGRRHPHLPKFFPAPLQPTGDPFQAGKWLVSLGLSCVLHLLFLGCVAGLYFSRVTSPFFMKYASPPASGLAMPVSLQMIHPVNQTPVPLKKPALPMLSVKKPMTERPVKAAHLQKLRIAIPTHVSGEAASLAKLVIGSDHFPAPPYPEEARDQGESGTVCFHLTFDQAGRIAGAEIVASSGYVDLDQNARTFILKHWHNDAFSRQVITVPIVYTLTQP